VAVSATQSTLTDATGRYFLPNLSPGTVTVTISKAGTVFAVFDQLGVLTDLPHASQHEGSFQEVRRPDRAGFSPRMANLRPQQNVYWQFCCGVP
jgi:hypothetical protein